VCPCMCSCCRWHRRRGVSGGYVSCYVCVPACAPVLPRRRCFFTEGGQGGISRESIAKEHRVMRSSLPIHLNRHCFVLGQLTFEMAHNVHIEDQKHIPMRPSLFHIRPFVHSLFDLVRQWPLCGCGQCSNEWFQHGWQCPSSLR
jgi:hypothetical protein